MDLESLPLNDEFYHMLNENPQKSNQLIEDLCRNNPDKEEAIRSATQLIFHYQSENKEFDKEELAIMWNNILQKSKAGKRARIFRISPVWQIAASVTVLLFITFYFCQYSRNKSIQKFAEETVAASDEARIIKSDGSEYLLKSNNSHIKYEADGKEIIIEGKTDQTEKLANQPVETKAIFNQVVVPYGRKYSLTLCDGTFVQLNSGSRLIFPAKFSDSKREVFLKGEGYFEVAKDESNPFIVKTDFMNIKVLGTHFNISAYENEESASAVLVEGSIEVHNNNFFNNHQLKIKPGEGCFYTGKDSEFRIQNVDVNEYVSWKDGFIQIKDQPFANITKKVERYYNKTIVFEDNELAHRIISGKLVLDDRLEKSLDFLAKTTKSLYKLQENGVYVFVKKSL